MKIVIYTVLIGAYDLIPSIAFTEDGVDYICYTDNYEYCKNQENSEGWIIKKIFFSGSPKECSRAVKIMPHLFLEHKYDYSV